MVSFRPLDPEHSVVEIARVHELVAQDLSEPYTVAIYNYFIQNWPDLAIFAYEESDPEHPVGVIVGGLRIHQNKKIRGYIAMLAVRKEARGKGIAKRLVQEQIQAFIARNADEVILEAEADNKAGLGLYLGQGFIRTRRMTRYYFGMSDAYRLVLPLTEKALTPTIFLPDLPAAGLPAEKV